MHTDGGWGGGGGGGGRGGSGRHAGLDYCELMSNKHGKIVIITVVFIMV